MYTITAQDIDVLTELSEANGIAPIDVAVVLYTESAGFNPASLGPGGTGAYSGLNQMSVANLATYGIAPADWVTYSAAEQLPIIFKFWQGLANTFNGGHFPANAAVLTALNFLPGNYKTSGAANNPDAVITAPPSTYYTKNTLYDPNKTGTITLNTIAARVAIQAASTDARWKQIQALVGGTVTAPQASGGSFSITTAQAVPPAAKAVLGGLLIGGLAFVAKREWDTRPVLRRKVMRYV